MDRALDGCRMLAPDTGNAMRPKRASTSHAMP
jgi:hypothetical protein